ncbi:MAG: hypothetical protein K6G22_06170 [Lachnospiraceae bacterium]|nr:hypothetical protein [Lachnospiraceae bacterium]
MISLTLVSALSINLVACGSSGSNETTASVSIEASDVVDAQITTEPTTKQSTESPAEVNEAQEIGAYEVVQLEVVDPDGKASTISGLIKKSGMPVR